MIGASWAALFLAKGLEVVAIDVAPDAETWLRRFVASAWPALDRQGLAPGALQSNLSFTTRMSEGIESVDFIQENGPEKIDFKRDLFRRIDAQAAPDVLIASSSSGITMSEIQSECAAHPARCVIGHPFNPPHLMPLVEVVGGARTSEATVRRATEFYAGLGKQVVRLRKEMSGHIANRLQAALMREVYYLVAEDVVSVADVDKALCWGPGLRWGIMGQVLLNHLGGGRGGIVHFFEQFAEPMTARWKTLGSPVLTAAVRRKLADGIREEVGSRSIAELAAQRDEILLDLIELRRRHEW